jgi:hypothetical protein
MSTLRFIKGTELHKDDQKKVLAAFVHRYTGEHVPAWALKPMPNGGTYTPQFATDAEWLAHSTFGVKNNGRLHAAVKHCNSNPTNPIRTGAY